MFCIDRDGVTRLLELLMMTMMVVKTAIKWERKYVSMPWPHQSISYPVP